MFTLYILQSENNNHFYIGVTKNINDRLNRHNKGYSKSTKPYAPWSVIHAESFSTREEAMKREHFLKSPKDYIEKNLLLKNFKKVGCRSG